MPLNDFTYKSFCGPTTGCIRLTLLQLAIPRIITDRKKIFKCALNVKKINKIEKKPQLNNVHPLVILINPTSLK